MSTLDVATTALPAIARSGLLNPVFDPRRLFRMARATTHGTNVSTLLAISAARWPNRTAIIDGSGAQTYAELTTATDRLARALYHRHGVRPGDPVGVMCRNGREFVMGVFASASLGADVVLLNTDFNPPALASSLTSHGIRIVVGDDEFADTVRAAGAALFISPAVVDERGPKPPRAPAGRLVLLTSGTTGAPKGVPRTPGPGAVAGVAVTVLSRTGLKAGDRVVVSVPFFHAFGFATLMLGLALGGTLITRRRFDAEAALAQISLYRAEAFIAVPIMLSRILELPEKVRNRNPVTSLRVVLCGAAPLDPALATRFMDAFGDILFNGYGSSEVGLGSLAGPDDLRRSPATVGKPVAGAPVRILDDHDVPVPTGTIGRIFVGGRLNFDGYTGGARKAVVKDLTSTGDMGYLDERGCLFIVGREDDMIVSGGENVYPQALENALAEHPDIADNAVIGVPDPEFGQRLAAFVVSRPGTDLRAESLRTYLKANVSRFEQPRDIRFVEETPRNPSGKILRRELVINHSSTIG